MSSSKYRHVARRLQIEQFSIFKRTKTIELGVEPSPQIFESLCINPRYLTFSRDSFKEDPLLRHLLIRIGNDLIHFSCMQHMSISKLSPILSLDMLSTHRRSFSGKSHLKNRQGLVMAPPTTVCKLYKDRYGRHARTALRINWTSYSVEDEGLSSQGWTEGNATASLVLSMNIDG